MILRALKQAFHHIADDIEEFLSFIFFLFIMFCSLVIVIGSISLAGYGLVLLLR